MGIFKPTKELLEDILLREHGYLKGGILSFNGVKIETRQGSCTISLCLGGVPLAISENSPWGVDDVIEVRIHEGTMKVIMEGFG